jgi:hypothetical protein
MRNHEYRKLSLTLVIVTTALLAAATQARAEDAIVKLVSSANGKCLQPINGSRNQGDAIVQETCNGSTAQQWTVHLVNSTRTHLINRDSGLCLDARGKAANGTPIQQWTCNGISNENWGWGITNNLLDSAVSNSWTHCIATPGNQDGLAMELRSCNSGDNSQQWTRPQG